MHRISLLAAAIASAFAAGAAESFVPIVNSGFGGILGGKPVGWRLSSGCRIDRGAGYNGSPCLVIHADDFKLRESASSELPPLQVGKRYTFGALIRTGDDFRTTNPHGAKMRLSWRDARGKWLGEMHTTSVRSAGSDWVECVGTTVPLPTNAASFSVAMFIPGTGKGTAYFDNVYVRCVEQPVLGDLNVSAYRRMAADGRVRFFAPVHAPDGVAASDISIRLRYRGADGKGKSAAGVLSDTGDARIEVAVADLAMGRQTVRCEAVDASGKVLGSASSDFTRVAELPKRKVWIDARGRMIADGKPFFPLGMYTGPMIGDKAERMELYARSPFNCAMQYKPLDRESMDAYHAHGIKLFYGRLRAKWAGTEWARQNGFKTDAETEAWVTATIDEVKRHPALLGWYVFDEPTLELKPKQERLYSLLVEHDPDHPAWGVIAEWQNSREFVSSCDYLGTDAYPIATRGPFDNVLRSARLGRDATGGTHPTINVPQTFSWKWLHPERVKERMPTREEIRSMFWQNIAGGANGLICYMYHDLWRNAPDGLPGYRGHWDDICTVAAEVKRMFPVLLSDGEPRTVKGETRYLGARTWVMDGETYVLVVNASHEERTTGLLEISGGAWKSCTTEVGSDLRVVDGKLSADLPPMGVAFVKLSGSDTAALENAR